MHPLHIGIVWGVLIAARLAAAKRNEGTCDSESCLAKDALTAKLNGILGGPPQLVKGVEYLPLLRPPGKRTHSWVDWVEANAEEIVESLADTARVLFQNDVKGSVANSFGFGVDLVPLDDAGLLDAALYMEDAVVNVAEINVPAVAEWVQGIVDVVGVMTDLYIAQPKPSRTAGTLIK